VRRSQLCLDLAHAAQDRRRVWRILGKGEGEGMELSNQRRKRLSVGGKYMYIYIQLGYRVNSRKILINTNEHIYHSGESKVEPDRKRTRPRRPRRPYLPSWHPYDLRSLVLIRYLYTIQSIYIYLSYHDGREVRIHVISSSAHQHRISKDSQANWA